LSAALDRLDSLGEANEQGERRDRDHNDPEVQQRVLHRNALGAQ